MITYIELSNELSGFDMSWSEIMDKDQSHSDSFFIPKVTQKFICGS